MLNRSFMMLSAGAAVALLAACGEKADAPATAKGGAETPAAQSAGVKPEDAIRDVVRIVGSSTVYPFSSFVAEDMGAVTDFKSPVVERTGSGGGMKLFCSGVGKDTPDFTNASRRMKDKEFKLCTENGVTDIVEVKVGFDGIVIAQSKTNAPLQISKMQLLLAVAAEVPVNGQLVANPYTNWNQIDPTLPNRPIQIYGPPKSSGTRDAFEDMILKGQTKKMAEYGKKKYKKIRDDGLYLPSGENDNLIVQKLQTSADAIGIFGFSFLEENKDKIQPATIGGVSPSPDTISSGEYPISRSLFFYVKVAHEDKVPGMSEYIESFTSERMIGPDSELSEIGLIPLPTAEREAVRAAVAARTKLTAESLAEGH